ncbi:KTSC domain-containing protein [Thermoplasmatales archaeon SW_10_69_26]|jgi:hypothetical protein|nr:MAG: KTSC domain-containing protein [Thermoplasmatales archaeon SW_10_69_26]
MKRDSVQSSNIDSVGYDADQMTLEVEFNDGSIYQYFDVPKHVYEGLMRAESHGEFLHQNVKGIYRYRRL